MTVPKRWWSVKLRMEEGDVNAISGVPNPMLEPGVEGVRHIHFGGSQEEADDPPSVTFELQAASWTDAEERAQTFAYRMRRAAKLPDALSPIVWIAPLGDDCESSRYLDHARSLIHSEQYGLAVVAAQIHFEVHVRALLKEAASASPLRWAVRLLKEGKVAELKRPFSLAAVELLLGLDVTQVSEWQRFQAHIDRRNDVVHKGQTVGKSEAEESVAVVQQLWIQLTEAARKRREENTSP